MVATHETNNIGKNRGSCYQVLFKRKPFALLPPPPNIPDNAEVYVMRGTQEVFLDYEKYLKRLDYLMQKKFVDAVNGKSGLSFFDALESENKSTTAIETVFPPVLRDPILRKVQFSTISRIDDLVNAVYEEFKRDFFPGEDIIIIGANGGENLQGVIREKAKFPQIRGPNGEIQRLAFARYFVTIRGGEFEDSLLDEKHLRRDKKAFTKQNLRAFLKHSLQREAWIGAPWLVKEHLAITYRLPMEIPAHLLQDAKILQNKQQMIQAKHSRKQPRAKNFSQDEQQRAQFAQAEQMRVDSKMEARQPPPPPTIKYPIEDLDIAPKRNGVVRPGLQFFTDDMAAYVKEGRRDFSPEHISMESMGLLLEVWNTLNVQCEVYVLDSFTFDDFVDAMQYHSLEPSCELLDEAYCAVLKLLVDDKGTLTLPKNTLPQMPTDSDESSEEHNDESEVSTPLPNAPARSTRSRLSQVEPSPAVVEMIHRATDMIGDRDWMTRLGQRDFENGGWEVILVGLLYQLSLSPVWTERANKILAHLAPVDMDATRDTVLYQFSTMDVNLRIMALQIITMLSITTPSIKDFLEACSEDMTDVRKRKIEAQKAKKLAVEELAVKDRERKILLPDNMLPDSPPEDSVDPTSTNNTDIEDSVEVNGTMSSDPDDDDAPVVVGRSLRRDKDRKRKRDEEAARAAEEKKKAELAKQQPKQSKEFRKLLAEIEELKNKVQEQEDKITDCDSDLREANVQRTKVLGRDRFCNRYYWFERNGQPFAGLPSSSTASYGYANGRIWVQGPDSLETAGLIDRTPEDQQEYQRQFNLTVPERRTLEEGVSTLHTSKEWGYYDDPILLDNLISWLDERGEREKRLRKELVDWRDVIAQYMDAHKKFKDEDAARRLGNDEEPHASRISTRHRAHEDQTAARERCLKWTNQMALDKIGHLHSQPQRPKTRTKVAIRPPRGLAVPTNRHGKPVTRQGL